MRRNENRAHGDMKSATMDSEQHSEQRGKLFQYGTQSALIFEFFLV